jgi:HEAT repeat protein
MRARTSATGQLQECTDAAHNSQAPTAHPPITEAELPPPHQAVRELASRADATTLRALADAAIADDQFLRRTAIEVIGSHPRGRELAAIVLSAFLDSSEYVVCTACDVVARWELNEAHDLVLAQVTSPSRATRRSAIRALNKIWLDRDVPTLLRIYRNDSAPDVRREAAWALRYRVSSEGWRPVFDKFYVDELARHRQWACELAEAFSGPDVLPILAQLSSDRDGHVRKAAARAIQTVSRRE